MKLTTSWNNWTPMYLANFPKVLIKKSKFHGKIVPRMCSKSHQKIIKKQLPINTKKKYRVFIFRGKCVYSLNFLRSVHPLARSSLKRLPHLLRSRSASIGRSAVTTRFVNQRCRGSKTELAWSRLSEFWLLARTSVTYSNFGAKSSKYCGEITPHLCSKSHQQFI